ncbi:MAG: RNA polymerase sigma factor [Gammaproteobacteria bacterium]
MDGGDDLDRFLAGVERRALRMAQFATGSRDDALDIVQEAMMTLVRSYGTRPPGEWGPLFHRVLQSRINDWHRRRVVRNRLRVWLGRKGEDDDAPDWTESIADERPGPDGALGGEQALGAIERALRRLPLRQQQAFLLRAWEGLDVKDTARAMGCTEGSVKTHYFRAVNALRAQLGEHWT